MTHLTNLTSTLLGAAADRLPAPSVVSYFDLREARRTLVRSIEDSTVVTPACAGCLGSACPRKTPRPTSASAL